MQDLVALPSYSAAAAVIVNFSLGLRVGELVALKWNDLKEPYLHIRRMEQKQFFHPRLISKDQGNE